MAELLAFFVMALVERRAFAIIVAAGIGLLVHWLSSDSEELVIIAACGSYILIAIMRAVLTIPDGKEHQPLLSYKPGSASKPSRIDWKPPGSRLWAACARRW